MCSEPRSLHRFQKQQLLLALHLMLFTTLNASFRASSSRHHILSHQWLLCKKAELSRTSTHLSVHSHGSSPISCDCYTVFPGQGPLHQIHIHNVETVLCFCSLWSIAWVGVDMGCGLLLKLPERSSICHWCHWIAAWFSPFLPLIDPELLLPCPRRRVK